MGLSRDGITDFSGGVRSASAYRDIGPNELPRIENYRLGYARDLVTRWGSQRATTSALDPIVGLGVMGAYHWNKSDGTTPVLVIHADGGLLVEDANYLTYPLTLSDAGSAGSNAPTNFAGFLDASGAALYFTNGDLVQKFVAVGTPIADVAPSLSVKQVIVYNRRLFGFNGDTLYWSDLDNGDTLGDATNGGGQARVRTFGSGDITGLVTLGSTLFVFHQYGISRFRGWTQDDIDIESGLNAVVNPVGALGWRSLVSFDGFVYWVAPNMNVYRMNEAGAVERVDIKVDLGFDPLTAVVAIANPADREIWFHQAGGASAVVWSLSVDLGAWAKFSYSGDGFNAFALVNGENNRRVPTVLGCAVDGHVYDLRYTTAPLDLVGPTGLGGSTVIRVVETPPFDFGDRTLFKALRFAWVDMENVVGGVTVAVIGDDQVVGTPVGKFPTESLTRFHVSGRHRTPALQVADANTTFTRLSEIALDAFVYRRSL